MIEENNVLLKKEYIYRFDDLFEYFSESDDLMVKMYQDSKENIFFRYYLGTPSNKSYVLFGTLYDPDTGYMYFTLFKNRKSVIAYDAVALFNKMFNKNFNLIEYNDGFLKFKFTSNVDDIFSGDHSIKSLIKRNLLKDMFSFNLSIENNIKSILPKLTDLKSILGDIYKDSINNVVNQTVNVNKETINKEIQSIPFFFEENLKEIRLDKLSCLPYISRFNTKGDDLWYGDDKTIIGKSDRLTINILRQNINELLDSKDYVVYSNKMSQTLKKCGFGELIDKNIEDKLNIIDSLSLLSDVSTEESIYYNNHTVLNIGNRSYEAFKFSKALSEIIFINKALRKLDK